MTAPYAFQATSVGQAVAGFGVSVLSFLTLWAAPSGEHGEVRRPADVAGAAFAYFGLSAAVVAASVAGYWWLQRLPFWHYYTRTADGREGAHGSKCLLRGTASVQCMVCQCTHTLDAA